MRCLAVSVACVLAAARAWAEPPSPVGRWLTEDRGGVIEIAPCGRETLCGRILGMDYTGAMPTDRWHRPQCGLALLYDLKPGENSWNGRVLDPKGGQFYSARVSVPQPDTLKLHGYIGLAVFGETVTWTRYRGGPIGPACRMHP